MRYSFIAVLVLALPLVAVAQNYSTAPIIVDPNAPPVTPSNADAAPDHVAVTKPIAAVNGWAPNFPDAAVTRIGANSTGQTDDTPPAPATPTAPAAPDAPTPASPAAPAAPASPISKLWPRDTVPVFLQSCTGFHPELVVPCTCVITTLMGQMGHDEFMQLSADGTIEQDPRVKSARAQCIPGPARRD
jgi:hypothetical protein